MLHACADCAELSLRDAILVPGPIVSGLPYLSLPFVFVVPDLWFPEFDLVALQIHDPCKYAILVVLRAFLYKDALGSWVVYTVLCASALARTGVLFGIVLLLAGTALAWAQSQFFSGRGAYIQFWGCHRHNHGGQRVSGDYAGTTKTRGSSGEWAKPESGMGCQGKIALYA